MELQNNCTMKLIAYTVIALLRLTELHSSNGSFRLVT